MNIHCLRHLTDVEVYDETIDQPNIVDGDVLLMSCDRTAVMVGALPTMVCGVSPELHRLAPDWDWGNFRDGKYIASARIAKRSRSAV